MIGDKRFLKIIVAEYPKSGGSWFVSMLGDILGIKKRDIYVTNEYNSFDISKHPWYLNQQNIGLEQPCVIKSHELPDSEMHSISSNVIHLIRDGRDVVISKYFYEKDFCVKNGILSEFNYSFDDYLIKTAIEWASYIKAWNSCSKVTCKYEDLLHNTTETIKKTLAKLNLSFNDDSINEGVIRNTKEDMIKSTELLFKYNTFVRKGVDGDWKNYFTEKNIIDFKLYAGDVLTSLGYEVNAEW